MSIDDFFTLPEINNGLTAPSRVRELMVVMQKERDFFEKNAADSARQRSRVASVIMTTENKDCLDIFLQDGLHYLCNWLKDAQVSSNDQNSSFLEEHITIMLLALEKLNVGYEKMIASEIWTMVENFLNHNSCQVQDKARELLESWKTKGEICACPLDVIKARGLTDDYAKGRGCSETSLNNNGHEITRYDKVLSTSSDAVIQDHIGMMHESNKNSDSPTGDGGALSHHVGALSLPKPTVVPSHSHSVGTNNGTEPHSPVSSRQDTPCACTDFHVQRSNQCEDVTEPSPQKNSSEGLLQVVSAGKCEEDCASNADQYRSSSDFIPKEGGDIKCCSLPESSRMISWKIFFSRIRKQMDKEESDLASNRPEVEIDYSIVDPLEVAMEVEREILDYWEQSCSFPKKFPGSNNNSLRSKRPVSVSRKNSPLDEANGSSSSNDSATSSNNPDTEGTLDVATSQVTDAAQKAAQEDAIAEEKDPHIFFDVNQEVISGDIDARPENHLSSVVSVVSAARATPSTSKPPGYPLEFEVNLGWNSPALMSTFQPASPRWTLEGEQQECGLDFYLNAGKSIEDAFVEANSKKPELPMLNLNHISEDGGGALFSWPIGSFYPQLSPDQPARRIDLNDWPSFTNVSSNNSSCRNSPASQNFCDSAITIMGKRVEINPKDSFASQTLTSENGHISEVTFDYYLERMSNFIGIGSTVPYAHSPVFGYSTVAPWPTMPYLGQVYGPEHHPIPYIVDSKRATSFPQIMGSASGLADASSQTPFLVNGLGPSSSNFDPNSGMVGESGSRDPSGLELGLYSTLDGANPKATIESSVGGKRKEPDDRYDEEHYPFKHFLPLR